MRSVITCFRRTSHKHRRAERDRQTGRLLLDTPSLNGPSVPVVDRKRAQAPVQSARMRASSTGLVYIGQWPESMST